MEFKFAYNGPVILPVAPPVVEEDVETLEEMAEEWQKRKDEIGIQLEKAAADFSENPPEPTYLKYLADFATPQGKILKGAKLLKGALKVIKSEAEDWAKKQLGL